MVLHSLLSLTRLIGPQWNAYYSERSSQSPEGDLLSDYFGDEAELQVRKLLVQVEHAHNISRQYYGAVGGLLLFS